MIKFMPGLVRRLQLNIWPNEEDPENREGNSFSVGELSIGEGLKTTLRCLLVELSSSPTFSDESKKLEDDDFNFEEEDILSLYNKIKDPEGYNLDKNEQKLALNFLLCYCGFFFYQDGKYVLYFNTENGVLIGERLSDQAFVMPEKCEFYFSNLYTFAVGLYAILRKYTAGNSGAKEFDIGQDGYASIIPYLDFMINKIFRRVPPNGFAIQPRFNSINKGAHNFIRALENLMPEIRKKDDPTTCFNENSELIKKAFLNKAFDFKANASEQVFQYPKKFASSVAVADVPSATVSHANLSVDDILKIEQYHDFVRALSEADCKSLFVPEGSEDKVFEKILKFSEEKFEQLKNLYERTPKKTKKIYLHRKSPWTYIITLLEEPEMGGKNLNMKIFLSKLVVKKYVNCRAYALESENSNKKMYIEMAIKLSVNYGFAEELAANRFFKEELIRHSPGVTPKSCLLTSSQECKEFIKYIDIKEMIIHKEFFSKFTYLKNFYDFIKYCSVDQFKVLCDNLFDIQYWGEAAQDIPSLEILNEEKILAYFKEEDKRAKEKVRDFKAGAFSRWVKIQACNLFLKNEGIGRGIIKNIGDSDAESYLKLITHPVYVQEFEDESKKMVSKFMGSQCFDDFLLRKYSGIFDSYATWSLIDIDVFRGFVERTHFRIDFEKYFKEKHSREEFSISKISIEQLGVLHSICPGISIKKINKNERKRVFESSRYDLILYFMKLAPLSYGDIVDEILNYGANPILHIVSERSHGFLPSLNKDFCEIIKFLFKGHDEVNLEKLFTKSANAERLFRLLHESEIINAENFVGWIDFFLAKYPSQAETIQDYCVALVKAQKIDSKILGVFATNTRGKRKEQPDEPPQPSYKKTRSDTQEQMKLPSVGHDAIAASFAFPPQSDCGAISTLPLDAIEYDVAPLEEEWWKDVLGLGNSAASSSSSSPSAAYLLFTQSQPPLPPILSPAQVPAGSNGMSMLPSDAMKCDFEPPEGEWWETIVERWNDEPAPSSSSSDAVLLFTQSQQPAANSSSEHFENKEKAYMTAMGSGNF